MEVWKDIPGYVGLYQVSDRGRVRSLDRQVVDKHGVTRHVAGRVMCLVPKDNGYLQVVLSDSGMTRHWHVHILVALAFLGHRPRNNEVRHLDGSRNNNVLSNLAYGTRSDNKRDMRVHGTHNYGARTHCKHGHEYTAENTYIQVCRSKYGTTEARICRTCKRNRRRERTEK